MGSHSVMLPGTAAATRLPSPLKATALMGSSAGNQELSSPGHTDNLIVKENTCMKEYVQCTITT